MEPQPREDFLVGLADHVDDHFVAHRVVLVGAPEPAGLPAFRVVGVDDHVAFDEPFVVVAAEVGTGDQLPTERLRQLEATEVGGRLRLRDLEGGWDPWSPRRSKARRSSREGRGGEGVRAPARAGRGSSSPNPVLYVGCRPLEKRYEILTGTGGGIADASRGPRE